MSDEELFLLVRRTSSLFCKLHPEDSLEDFRIERVKFDESDRLVGRASYVEGGKRVFRDYVSDLPSVNKSEAKGEYVKLCRETFNVDSIEELELLLQANGI